MGGLTAFDVIGALMLHDNHEQVHWLALGRGKDEATRASAMRPSSTWSAGHHGRLVASWVSLPWRRS